jgi:SAM-dependent methyltransferase
VEKQIVRPVHEIIHNLIDNNRLVSFYKGIPLSALDLGCRYDAAVFFLYHYYPFSRVVGVEIELESIVMEKYRLMRLYEIKQKINVNCKYELYLDIIKDENISAGTKPRLSKEEFDSGKFIELKYGTSFDHYFFNCFEKFDLVNIGNILHLIKSPSVRQELLKNASSRVKFGGLLFVKVVHPESKQKVKICKNGDYFLDFTDEEFLQLIPENWETVYVQQKGYVGELPNSKIFLARKTGTTTGLNVAHPG